MKRTWSHENQSPRNLRLASHWWIPPTTWTAAGTFAPSWFWCLHKPNTWMGFIAITLSHRSHGYFLRFSHLLSMHVLGFGYIMLKMFQWDGNQWSAVLRPNTEATPINSKTLANIHIYLPHAFREATKIVIHPHSFNCEDRYIQASPVLFQIS
jgi:hypothetical protein